MGTKPSTGVGGWGGHVEPIPYCLVLCRLAKIYFVPKVCWILHGEGGGEKGGEGDNRDI